MASTLELPRSEIKFPHYCVVCGAPAVRLIGMEKLFVFPEAITLGFFWPS
jgi:hypothetical protein